MTDVPEPAASAKKTHARARRVLRALSVTNSIPAATSHSNTAAKKQQPRPDRFIPFGLRNGSFRLKGQLRRSSCPSIISSTPSARRPLRSTSTQEAGVAQHEIDCAMPARLANALGFEEDERVIMFRSEHRRHTSADSTSQSSAPGGSPTSSRDGGRIPSHKPSTIPQSMIFANATIIRPTRVLEAPGLRDDFYASLVASSLQGPLAMATGSLVRTWMLSHGSRIIYDAGTRIVCSLSYSDDGLVLAIGLSDGQVILYDCTHGDKFLTLGHEGEAGILAWQPRSSYCDQAKEYMLLVGEGRGQVDLYRFRFRQTRRTVAVEAMSVSNTMAHTEQVCGLAWTPDGAMFASGGNDNEVILYNRDRDPPRIVHNWRHSAAVKAIAFCPWHSEIIATGAGTKDRHVRVFHCVSGSILYTFDTGAQITSITWSLTYRELLVAFGFGSWRNRSRLSVYTYPTFRRVIDVPKAYDEQRTMLAVRTPGSVSARDVSASSSSEPGDGVVIASSDGTFCFFHIWDKSKRIAHRGAQIIRWQGYLGSDILEMVEGFDKGTDGYIR